MSSEKEGVIPGHRHLRNIQCPDKDVYAISGQVKQAEARKQQAMFQYRQARLHGFRGVEGARIKTSKGREQLTAQERQVHALEEYARRADAENQLNT